jgi:hypothetical protein
LDDFDPYAPPPVTEAKRILITDSRTDLEKDITFLIKDRVGTFDRDLMTLEEIDKALGRSMFGKSKNQLTNALTAIGAVKLGQKWVSGRWVDHFGFMPWPRYRVSLWAVRNVHFWQSASAQDCSAEYGFSTGVFARWDEPVLDYIFEQFAVEIAHDAQSGTTSPISSEDAQESEVLHRIIEGSRLANAN